MKYISNVLFIIGLMTVFFGICLGDTNFLLAIKMMMGGFIVAWIGWLLTEFYEWREEMKYGF